MSKNPNNAMALIAIAVLMSCSAALHAADIDGSKDPEGMRRFDGSEIVAYRAPLYEEYVLPLGKVVGVYPTKYTKSLKVEGLLSRYTYGAPMGTSTTELIRNYKDEFNRLNLAVLYEEGPNAYNYGSVLEPVANEDGLNKLFEGSSMAGKDYVLVGKSPDMPPSYYFVYVGFKGEYSWTDKLKDKQSFAQLIVITPKQLKNRMVPTADEMSQALNDQGKVLLYGILFDTDKDTLKPESTPTLQEVSNLMKKQPQLKLRVVGHTDAQGSADHNLDLSKRRAQSVVHELTSKYGISSDRLDAFGCGLYAPVATNTSEEGRAKNRRVELLPWS